MKRGHDPRQDGSTVCQSFDTDMDWGWGDSNVAELVRCLYTSAEMHSQSPTFERILMEGLRRGRKTKWFAPIMAVVHGRSAGIHFVEEFPGVLYHSETEDEGRGSACGLAWCWRRHYTIGAKGKRAEALADDLCSSVAAANDAAEEAGEVHEVDPGWSCCESASNRGFDDH